MKDYPYNIEETFYAKNEYMFSKSAASLCSGKCIVANIFISLWRMSFSYVKYVKSKTFRLVLA